MRDLGCDPAFGGYERQQSDRRHQQRPGGAHLFDRELLDRRRFVQGGARAYSKAVSGEEGGVKNTAPVLLFRVFLLTLNASRLTEVTCPPTPRPSKTCRL